MNLSYSANSEEKIGRTSRSGKIIVISVNWTGLANHLALFAHVIGFAEEQGHRVVNGTFYPLAGMFETTRRDSALCAYPSRTCKKAGDVPFGVPRRREPEVFDRAVRAWDFLMIQFRTLFGRRGYARWLQLQDPIQRWWQDNADSGKNPKVAFLKPLPESQDTQLDGEEVADKIRDADIVVLGADGWLFRAPECVKRHAESIRRYFQPAGACEGAISGRLSRLRQRAEIVVGVHIRAGDYRTWMGGKYYFPVECYAAWMRELLELLPSRKVTFLICSNERISRREFPGLSVEFGHRFSPPVEDLYALAGCDYIFGPVSTFSLWASFYGKTPLFLLDDRNQHMSLDQFRVCYV